MNPIERTAKEFSQFLPRDYRKRKVNIRAAESVTLSDLNWSGGTRSVYSIFTTAGEFVNNSAKFNALAPWDNRAEGARLPIPAGFVVVRTGHFCGKQSTATIYANPADMPRYLSAPAS